jgi:membrane protease YdiL (CAAX protease family)
MRAMLIPQIAGIFPQLHVQLVVLFAALLFGIFHLYQGWGGFVVTTLSGMAFGLLYIASGSLLLPVIVHIAFDLRFVNAYPWRCGTSVATLKELAAKRG